MGIFGNSSPFDEDVEKATSENNTTEQWGLILEICDRAIGENARGYLRAALRRLGHPDPHVAMQAATLLDACVSNSGRAFHLEVASRDCEAELRRVLARAQPAVATRLRQLLRKWAEGEFKDDPQLDIVPALWARVRRDEPDAQTPAAPPSSSASSSAAAAAERRERDELARAIALSLREAPAAAATAVAPAPAAAPLYPSVEAAARPVRALYDFEAAEDNELTFLAGEIVHVTDSSDPNWWKGYNDRGEGLFPANFVTADLSEPTEPSGRARSAKSVQFAADSGPAEEAPGAVEPAALDAALALLLEADPAADADPRLLSLERAAAAMGPLIDAALQRADRRHARLTQLSAELVDALNLYHELMRDPPPLPPAYYAPPAPPAPRV